MICLFLDTASSNLIVSLYKGDKVLFYKQEKNDNDLSIKLLPLIDKALNESNLKIDDIEKIFVVNGPGSFTGVRIGVTTAKVIAWGLSKCIVPVSELELLSSIETNKKYIVPLIDARREYVYGAMYDNEGNNIIKDQHILLKDLVKKVNKYDDVLFVSNDNFDIQTDIPKIDVFKLINRHIEDKGINPHMVNPNYLKLTEAEEKLNDKRNN